MYLEISSEDLQMFSFHLVIDDVLECERVEALVADMGAQRINQEGWTTAYGGTGISMWFEMPYNKAVMADIIRSGLDATRIISCKKLVAA
jgi:hypothetical protein